MLEAQKETFINILKNLRGTLMVVSKLNIWNGNQQIPNVSTTMKSIFVTFLLFAKMTRSLWSMACPGVCMPHRTCSRNHDSFFVFAALDPCISVGYLRHVTVGKRNHDKWQHVLKQNHDEVVLVNLISGQKRLITYADLLPVLNDSL